jgi:hypothetical protein
MRSHCHGAAYFGLRSATTLGGLVTNNLQQKEYSLELITVLDRVAHPYIKNTTTFVGKVSMRTLFSASLLLVAALSACYVMPPPAQPSNNYNTPAAQPSGDPNGYPDGEPQQQPGNGGYGIGITGPNLGPNATYTCEATCNGAKASISCQGVDNCNAWCDEYNAPHAECKQ